MWPKSSHRRLNTLIGKDRLSIAFILVRWILSAGCAGVKGRERPSSWGRFPSRSIFLKSMVRPFPFGAPGLSSRRLVASRNSLELGLREGKLENLIQEREKRLGRPGIRGALPHKVVTIVVTLIPRATLRIAVTVRAVVGCGDSPAEMASDS